MKIKSVSVSERSRPRSSRFQDTLPDGRTKFRRRAYLTEMRAHNGLTRVYVFPSGESVIENVFNRRSRPHDAWRELVRKELLDAGIEFTRLRWSQYAGCSCPCSPGFIVHTPFASPIRDPLSGSPIDIFIHVTTE